jgi:hypothetical protein
MFATSAFAVCPIQPSAIAYVNGIGTLRKDADSSQKKLLAKVEQSLGVPHNPACLKGITAYNRSTNLPVDFLQAAYQKSRELGITAIEFWPAMLRLVAPTWLDEVIDASYPRSGDGALYVVGPQLQQHLNEFYKPEIATGKHLVVVGHSQGNFYANDAWKALTDAEKEKTSIVAIATPASFVAGEGRDTKLYEDALAATIFSFSLPANVTNTESCETDIFHPFSWLCHDMDTSYLHGTNSTKQIVDDIVAELPVATLPSSILYDGSNREFSPLDGSVTEQFLPPLSPQISGTITGIMFPILDSNIPISNQYYVTIFMASPPWTEVARSDYIPLDVHSLTQVYFPFSTPFTLVDASYGIDVCQNGYACAHNFYSPITPQSTETSPLWRPFIGIVYGTP